MNLSKDKKISQDFFDSIVNENINDFCMTEEEAIDDAINQLKSQGADLSIICKFSQAEQQELKSSLANLFKLIPNLNQNKNESKYLK